MKKLSTYLTTGLVSVLIAMLFTLGACSQDPTQDEVVSPPETEMTDEQVLEYMGYDLTEMTEYEEYYLIGDETVSKLRVDEVRNDCKTRIPYRNDQLLNKENQKIVLIPSGQYKDQIREAAEEWNKLYNAQTSNIQFTFTNPGKNAVEFITNAPSTFSSVSIVVDLPYKGVNSKLITLNLDFDNWYALDAQNPKSQIKYLYMHALGHLVGMRHALNYNDSPDWNDSHAGNLTDPSSIMINEAGYKDNKTLYSGFTSEDKQAINFLYPYVAPTPDAPTFGLTCTPNATGKSGNNLDQNKEYEITASYSYSPCPSPTYKFTITKNGVATSDFTRTDIGNGKIRIKFTKTGTYKLTAEVTNSKEQNTKSTIYNVVTPIPTIEGPANVELGINYDFKINYWNPDYPNITFNLWWDEMVLDSGIASVQKVNNTLFRIKFTEPGGFRILANITNGPITERELCHVTVYYKPYYKVETKRILLRPDFSINTKGISSDIAYRFKNTILFYADEACTQPIALGHDLVFNYTQKYTYRGLEPGIRSIENNKTKSQAENLENLAKSPFDIFTGDSGQIIVRKGQFNAALPETATRFYTTGVGSLIVKNPLDPYYTIEYPKNQFIPLL